MTLDFDYNQAIRQASQIDTIAGEMRTIANRRLTDAISSIDTSWDGDTSVIFLRHCTDTKTRILSKATELESLAQRVRDVARVVRETEERALSEIQASGSD